MHSNYRLDHHCMNDYYVAMVSQKQSWYPLGGIMFAISAICYVYDHVHSKDEFGSRYFLASHTPTRSIHGYNQQLSHNNI